MLVIAGIWIVTHLLFIYNERYTINVKDHMLLNNVSEQTYNLFVYDKEAGEQLFYIKHTTIRIFGMLPEWVLYFIQGGYYLIAGIGIYLIMEEEKLKKVN